SYISPFPGGNFENDLISEVLKWEKVHVKSLDGELATSQLTIVKEVQLREMLKYGPLEFLSKLKEKASEITAEQQVFSKVLLVEFEDYNNIRDLFLAYQIKKEFGPDCKLWEDLFIEIDKQLAESGKVEFNL